jgi:hypothetical protein
VCPARIDIANCLDVGVGDGLTNIIFLIYNTLGAGVTDFILGLFQTTVGLLFPGVATYLTEVLNSFKTATGDQLTRLQVCSILTLGSAAVVIFGAVIIGMFILFIVPLVYNLIVSALGLVAQTNVYESLLASGEPTEFDLIDGEDQAPAPAPLGEEDPDEDEEPIQAQLGGMGISARIARGLNLWINPKVKRE